MALTPRRHGVKIIEGAGGASALALVATSVWGLVAVAPNAAPEFGGTLRPG